MEESITGFICTGGWMDVVEHGERVTSAILEAEADTEYEEAVQRWESWRPKADERLSKDVSQKTADEASVTEGPGEQAGKSPDDDIRTAGKRITESVEKVEDRDPQEAFEKWRDSILYTARAADSTWRKVLRRIEVTLYKHVMTKLSPYYFDTELVQANITKKNGPNCYRFEVNIADDSLRDGIRERMLAYEDDVDRWHISTRKNIKTSTDAEGHSPTPEQEEEETDQSVKPERNIGRDDLDVPK